MTRLLCLFLLLLVAGCAAGTPQLSNESPVVKEEAPEIDMNVDLNKLSYAAGYKLGDMFQNQKLTPNHDAVLKGMYDARKNLTSGLTKAEMEVILRDPKAFLLKGRSTRAKEALEESTTFLKTNAQRKGVVELSSGLQYKVLDEGQGKSPQVNDSVKIIYTGRRVDGNIFSSSEASGGKAEFVVQSLVPGLIEGLQLMKEGGKSIFYIPDYLAFGNRGPMSNKAVIYEVELVEVLSKK